MELLTKLGIDWKLLLAQIVNFAIVAGVLTAVVYRPLLHLIDERRDRIAKAIADAKRIESQKVELETIRKQRLLDIDRECAAFLEEAKRQTEEVKQRILKSAEAEVQDILQKGGRQLREERARVFDEVKVAITQAILHMTEKILEREFTTADQKRILAQIEEQIPSLIT